MSQDNLNEIREIQKKTLELIGQAKTESAILLMKEFLETKSPSLYSKLVLISNRFYALKQKQTLGLSFEQSHLNDLNYDFINFVNSLESELSKTKSYDPKQLYKKSLGIVGISVTGIFATWIYFKDSEFSASKNYPIETTSITAATTSEELSLRAIAAKPETNPIPAPIRFPIDNRKNALTLVYYDNSIKRNDTFEINTDWQVYDLKQEIIRHYKPTAYNPLLFCNGEPLYYRGEGGEYISISSIIKKGDIKAYDKIRINSGSLARLDKKLNLKNTENLIAYNPTIPINWENTYFNVSAHPSRQLFVELDSRISMNYEVYFTNHESSFGKNKYHIAHQAHQNQGNHKRRKNKQYIVTSRFAIIEENEIRIVRESD